MARTVSIGAQNFAELRENDCFLVDKTDFLRQWWNSRDAVTLICRPRRFGKTLTLSMAECFFSLGYAGRGEELFSGLKIWDDPAMRPLQGAVPVVSLSFANVKRPTLDEAKRELKRVLCASVRAHGYLARSATLHASEKAFLEQVREDMDDATAATCLKELCAMLRAHHGTAPLVLLDEYDTPMQEAWLRGYWDSMSDFMRSLFNSTFKTNPFLGRALITGIARVASESIFSDMNNPRVVTVSTPAYETAFGFTQAEVDAALAEFGIDARDEVREWYDGFTFGSVGGVYNPWSITCLLKDKVFDYYWMNTSSNGLVSSLVRRGGVEFKEDFEALLAGATVERAVDERVDFRRLNSNADAVWALLLATGYVRLARRGSDVGKLEMAITNREVRAGFDAMVAEWFADGDDSYNGFVSALLEGDAYAMTSYLGDLAAGVMSSFDSGTRPSRQLPERFWHGLVLGLLAGLRGRYEVRSNPESGFGRCDVMLSPLDGPAGADPAIILEFKVLDARRDGERTLEDTVASAQEQIRRRNYAAAFAERGIPPERVRAYGIAFSGKTVLVG